MSETSTISAFIETKEPTAKTEAAHRIENFKKVEFWGVVTLFVFILFSFVTEGIGLDKGGLYPRTRQSFGDANIHFDYYRHYFFPQLIRYCLLFCAFLLVNFIAIPQILRKEKIYLNTFTIALVVLILTIVFGVTGTYLNAYLFASENSKQEIFNLIFYDAFLYTCRVLLLVVFYTMLKYTLVYVLVNIDKIQARHKAVTRGGLFAFMGWSIVLFLFMAGHVNGYLIIWWMTVIPVGILLYWYSFNSLIPSTIGKRRPFLNYLSKALAVLLLASFAITFILMLFIYDKEFAANLGTANFLVQALVTVPLTWVLFGRHLKGNEELYALKTELGQSNANLDFLRSQINPHFLFNALNTLYGTAIQEKAERTSEGIQQLGDMMRFMLQENLQEKIPLSRETEYLHNYISLQRLRTDAIPQVTIIANIDETVQPVQIAPMLLIPFVENAFKHGISFLEPSPIKVSFEFRDNTVYFDVFNNKHKTHNNDPEKDKSGIGLANVRNRLQHIYPGKHELIIRETTKEYFVHLTLRLGRK